MKKSIYRILVGTDVSVAAATGPQNIPTGGVVIFKDDFSILAPGETIADSPAIYIAQGTAQGPIISSAIRGDNAKSYSGISYIAPVLQVDAVGFNGTDGSIEISNSTEYYLSIVPKGDKILYNQARRYSYTSDSSATQVEIARNFVVLVNQDAAARVSSYILTNGTFTILPGGITLAVTNESVTATASGAGHGLVAGDLVRIGGTGATVPVYYVASVSGVTITLETSYQGATATIANANVGEMSVVTLVGIAFESKAQGTYEEYPVFFEVGVDLGFDATPSRNLTAVNFGHGVAAQVRALEDYALGHLGHLNRVFMPFAPPTYAVTGTTYDVYTIEHDNPSELSLSNFRKQPLATLVALPVASQVVNYAAFEAALNGWMASVPKAFPAVNL